MKRWLWLLLVPALAGCGWRVVRADPIPAQCDAMCFVPCKSAARWDADPADPAAWDALADTLADSRDETRQCEVRRKACEQCLTRLKAAGIITLP